MNKNKIAAFYWGAAMYMDLDSPEVDRILGEHNLSVQDNTTKECIACIRQHRPITPPLLAGLPPQPISPYISITQAAVITGFSRRTINEACLRGDIEDAFQGTRNEWQILPRSLQAWMDNPAKHRTGPRPEEKS